MIVMICNWNDQSK